MKRRDFLKTIGLGPAAMLAPVAPPSGPAAEAAKPLVQAMTPQDDYEFYMSASVFYSIPSVRLPE